jgi:hypothetical protein
MQGEVLWQGRHHVTSHAGPGTAWHVRGGSPRPAVIGFDVALVALTLIQALLEDSPWRGRSPRS